VLKINEQLSIPLSDFSFSFSRSGGPGGQNVNKVNTKVTLKWPLERSCLALSIQERFRAKYHRRINQDGELVLTSQRFRDQGRNVADCLEKLREMIAGVAEPRKARKATRPTRASRQRRLDDKKRKSDRKRQRRKPDLE
jgi:ribosome-associated protein